MLIICEVLAIVRIWKAGGEGVIDVIDEVVNSNVILFILNAQYSDSLTCGREGKLSWSLNGLKEGASSQFLTRVVFAVEVAGMASVHPPSGAILEGTVAVVHVVVVVGSAELHAVVNGVGLVTRVVPEVKAIEGVSCIAGKVVAVGQTVLILLWSNSEHGVVGIPGEKDLS